MTWSGYLKGSIYVYPGYPDFEIYKGPPYQLMYWLYLSVIFDESIVYLRECVPSKHTPNEGLEPSTLRLKV